MGIVAGASEATLERNAFYVGLKTMASNRATEIEALKGTIEQKTEEIVGRDREIDILKARCETLEYVPWRNLGDAVAADTIDPERRSTDSQGTTTPSRVQAAMKVKSHF
jgi:hypothetical protein